MTVHLNKLKIPKNFRAEPRPEIDWRNHNCFPGIDHWRPKIAAGLGIEIRDELGRGAFGCAYETNDPEKVLKITYDSSEAYAWAYIGEQQRAETKKALVYRGGFPIVDSVFELALDEADFRLVKDHRIYVILREDVLPLEAKYGEQEQGDWPAWLDQGLRHIDEGIDWQRNAMHYLLEGDKTRALSSAEKAKNEIDTVHLGTRLRPVARAVIAYFEDTGTYLGDLHAGNFGFRIHQKKVDPKSRSLGIDDLLVSDVGYSWSADKIRRKKLPVLKNPPEWAKTASQRDLATFVSNEGGAFQIVFDPRDYLWCLRDVSVRSFLSKKLAAYPGYERSPNTREHWRKWLDEEVRECDRGGPDYFPEMQKAWLAHPDRFDPPILALHPDGTIDIGDGTHRVAMSIVAGAPSFRALVGRPLKE